VRLRVRIKNGLYSRRDAFAYHIEEFKEYEGEVVPRPKWVGENYFCLSTGDPSWPFRILSKEDIVCGWKIKEKETKQKVYSIKNYVVTNRGNDWGCSCVGFTYRKKCSHIEEAKNAA
jgi:hypothetical protein